MKPVIILIVAQMIFCTKDILARSLVRNKEFGWDLMQSPGIWLVVTMHSIGLILQLYVLSSIAVGKAQTAAAVLTVILTNTLAWLILGEKISLTMYIAIMLAIFTFLFIIFAVK